LNGRRAVSVDAIESKMSRYAERVDRAIGKEFELYAHSRFHDPLIYAVSGGKRVRPLMLMLSAESLGYEGDNVLDAAVAVELLHTESIIHDDIIDEENARRGRMTFHVKYGYSASLLTADFVFSMILSIAARYKDRRVAEVISSAALHMSEGEYSELTIDPKVYKLDWDEYLEIVANKTASLFEASAKLGALIAGGSDKEVSALANYGKYLGIAYQIRDDLLDWKSRDKIALGLLTRYSEGEVVGKMTALSQDYAEEAKRQLILLPRSMASEFLSELTDFTIYRKY